MRCKKGEFVKGAYFHIYNRSVPHKQLFCSHDDYVYFLEKFKSAVDNCPASVFAYCLMPNHFHFLMKQNSRKPIFEIFSSVNNSYVPHYNHKYSSDGHLYNGRLQHKKVDNEKYVIYLCQYIHHNPKKAQIVDILSDWQYSNYLEWVGLRNGALFSDEILKESWLTADEYRAQTQYYQTNLDDAEFAKLLLDG
ncbi:MAG: transposase [Candidatus Brocadiia bacterium]